MTATFTLIEAAVREIETGAEDSFGTFEVVGNSDLFVQYMQRTINARYPFRIDPAQNLRTFTFGSVEEWVADEYVWLDVSLPPSEMAAWIDRYFREVLGCDADYQLTWKREQ